MKHKRYLFILVVMVAVSIQSLSAQQTVAELFRTYRSDKETTCVRLGRAIMGFASLFTNTMGVQNVEVIAFDSCNGDKREKVDAAIRNLKDPAYETMISTSEDNQRVKVMVRIEKETIKELIVLTSGDSPAFVRLKGNIKPSDIEQLVKEHSKNG